MNAAFQKLCAKLTAAGVPDARFDAAELYRLATGRDPRLDDGPSAAETARLSALAEPDIESDEGVSGYGMEFTLRLKKQDFADEELELENICGIFQQIAAVTFETNELFLPYEYLSSGQTAGVDAEHKSGITGFITVPDVKAQPITTPFGALEFVEFIGVTKAELDAVQNKCLTVEELCGKLGSDLTDYRRESVI